MKNTMTAKTPEPGWLNATDKIKIITLSKGGTKERKITPSQIQIPDLWHIAQNQEDPSDKEKILEVWHLAHDLLRHIREL